MTAFLDRLKFWRREPPEDFDFDALMATMNVVVPMPEYDALVADAEAWRAYQASQRPDYLADFGPNVPVEDLGGKPVYPGREKAP